MTHLALSRLVLLPGALLATLVLGACPGELQDPERFVGGGGACDDLEVEATLLPASCGGGACHGSGDSPADGLDLESAGLAGRLVGVASRCEDRILVDPGNPEASYFLEKLKPAPSCGAQMPLARVPLTDRELDCLTDWVVGLVGDGPDAGPPADAGVLPDAAGSPDGLVAHYEFDEGEGSIARDSSGFGDALDLVVSDPSAIEWRDGALALLQPTALSSTVPATKIADACAASGELTVAARVVNGDLTLDGPARIVTMSADTAQRNFLLGTRTDSFVFRLRTSQTDENGSPELLSGAGTANTELVHVAAVASGGSRQLYVDGALVAEDDVQGDYSTWQPFVLWLGNEADLSRPWLGELHELSIYCRALSTAELASAARP